MPDTAFLDISLALSSELVRLPPSVDWVTKSVKSSSRGEVVTTNGYLSFQINALVSPGMPGGTVIPGSRGA